MKDHFNREINYMRISITDRCNLRCRYCMPNGIQKVPMNRILSYEQIEEICRAAVSLGINRFKITGGEPLVRRGCVDLISKLKRIDGVENVTLTTNGILLPELSESLAEAGLDGVNVSLDTLDRDRYHYITGFDLLEKTLAGIDTALSFGLHTKVNSVLQKGVNEDDWQDLVLLAKDRPLDVRFIELMPIGDASSAESISNNELRETIVRLYPNTQQDNIVHGNGPAEYIHIPGFSGSIGFISAMHGKFCGSCNRIRLTSLGKIKTCLCYSDSYDITRAFEEKTPDARMEMLTLLLKEAIEGKQQEHHFEISDQITEHRKMFEIGG